MSVVNVPGFGYAEYSGGSAGSPTVIEPTGRDLSVFKLHSPTDPEAGVQSFFRMSADFVVGSVVELVNDGTGFQVSDVLASASVTPPPPTPAPAGSAVRCRKIASGTAIDWIVS